MAFTAMPSVAWAQGNSLFPKGNPNRSMPNATPLPKGALSPSSGAPSRNRRPAPAPPRPDTVALPYNLVWFDNQSRLASLFAGVSAKVTEKKADGPNEIWTVKELIAPNLRTSFFTFQQGMLIGLEFDYGQDNWDTDKYNEVMGQFRRLLETKCEAPGEIISRKTDQVPASTIKETLMGYQWTRGDTNVQLFYYSAEDTAKALNFRSISVHYHYRNPFGPAPGTEQAGATSPAPAPASTNGPAPGAQPPPGGKNGSVTVGPNGPDLPTTGNPPMPESSPVGTAPAPAPGAPGGAPAGSPAPAGPQIPAASPMPAGAPGASPTPEGTPTASPTLVVGSPAPEVTPGGSPAAPADTGDAAAAMAPAPSATPEASVSPSPSPTATPTPTPTPTPKKKKKKG